MTYHGYFCSMTQANLDKFLIEALQEDIGEGDHSSLAVIPESATGQAILLAKQSGIVAGLRVIKRLFEIFDPRLLADFIAVDGASIVPGQELMILKGPSLSILQTERLALNIVQRMSGIATQTAAYAEQLKGTRARILDTRKTTPNLRMLEKEAVRIGGGENHRMGLYDMIMLKDNHIDFAGGIPKAISQTREYLKRNRKALKIEIEVRDFSELDQVLQTGGIDRIMLDNFTPEETKRAIQLIGGRYETESSGGINLETIRSFALTGVDFISVGALTHQILSLDLSLKAKI